MSISLFVTILFGVVSVFISIIGGVIAVCKAIGGVRSEIAKLREDFVSNQLCHERRSLCPCLTQFRDITAAIDELEKRGKK